MGIKAIVGQAPRGFTFITPCFCQKGKQITFYFVHTVEAVYPHARMDHMRTTVYSYTVVQVTCLFSQSGFSIEGFLLPYFFFCEATKYKT